MNAGIGENPNREPCPDCLKLGKQLCFPLYACSREIVKKYKPYLDKLGLTYTQYITMMVMWERRQMSVKELGECLLLDSGTLTTHHKKLEQKGFVTRKRAHTDERILIVTLTEKGKQLAAKAVNIPDQMRSSLPLTEEEIRLLHSLLYKMLSKTIRGEAPKRQSP